MVIQRWQSVFLLIATVLILLFTFMPFASVTLDTEVADLHPKDFPVWLVVNIVIAVLLFMAIFMYRNLRRQKLVTIISMVLIGASAVTGGLTLYGPAAPEGAVELVWAGGIVLLILTLLMALAAYRGMSRDEKKLRSYDRIR